MGGCTHLFLPEIGTWPLNSRYTASVTGTATNGLRLEPAYEFEVQSPPSLSVAAVTPEDGTKGVATEGTQITVTFDRRLCRWSPRSIKGCCLGH